MVRENSCEEKRLLLGEDDASFGKLNYGAEESPCQSIVDNCHWNSSLSALAMTSSKLLSMTMLIVLLVTTGTLILGESDSKLTSGNTERHGDDLESNHRTEASADREPENLHSSGELVTASTECGQFLGRKEDEAFVFKVSPLCLLQD